MTFRAGMCRCGAAVAAAAFLAITAGCSSPTTDATTGSGGSPAASGTGDEGEVTLLVHDAFSLPDALKNDFERSSGLTLHVVAGDSGQQMVSQLVLTKDAPVADVVYGFTQNTAGALAGKDVIDPDGAREVPGADPYALDAVPGAVPVDHGEVCVNFDRDYFDQAQMRPPATLDDLLKDDYRGLMVTPDPAQGDTGLAFLYATIAAKGDQWPAYWEALKANGLKVVSGWSEAYEQEFSANGGTRPLVVSYASSPMATVTEDRTRTTTGAIEATCFAQTEYAGILAGAAHPDAAQKVLDWLTSEPVQAAIPDAMYMYPVREGVELPAGWSVFAPAPNPAKVLSLDPGEIASKNQDWLRTLADILG